MEKIYNFIALLITLLLGHAQAQADLLSNAIESGDVLMVAEVVRTNKIDVNKAYSNAITPLMLAVRKNSPEIVKFLLDNGADPNLVNYIGETATMMGLKGGSFKALSELLKLAKPDVIKKSIDLVDRTTGKTPLLF